MDTTLLDHQTVDDAVAPLGIDNPVEASTAPNATNNHTQDAQASTSPSRNPSQPDASSVVGFNRTLVQGTDFLATPPQMSGVSPASSSNHLELPASQTHAFGRRGSDMSSVSVNGSVSPITASASQQSMLMVGSASPNRNRASSSSSQQQQQQQKPIIQDTSVMGIGAVTDDHRGNLSHRLKVASRLFDLVSRVDDVDHPLCQECADELMVKLERRLSDARIERDTYASFLTDLKSQVDQDSVGSPTLATSPLNTSIGGTSIAHVVTSNYVSAVHPASSPSITISRLPTDTDLTTLHQREQNALAALRDLEIENEALEKELLQAEYDLKSIKDQEETYWQDVNNLERDLSTYQSQLESINLKYDQSTKRLDVLNKTNVYNDAFRIWHDGPFGTINGLRLGRLPNQPVEWSEINGAMGQTVLLLDTLANKLGFTFTTYRLVPLGSFSRIERMDGDKSMYELYGSNDIAGVLFWNRRFDHGLVAFLQCLKQLGDYAERQDTRFRLPYRIVKDRIGDVSIRMQFNQDEQWTKALKYTLIDIKWMLAFCSSRLES